MKWYLWVHLSLLTASCSLHSAKGIMRSPAKSLHAGGSTIVKMRLPSAKQRLSPKNALALYQMAHSVARIFESQRVKYWAAGGTLLGVVRNKGIIPHDDDVDINILSDDIPKLTGSRFNKELAMNGMVLIQQGDASSWQWKIQQENTEGTGKDFGVDIFAMMDVDGRMRYKGRHYAKYNFPSDVVTHLEQWPFGNSTLLAPSRTITEAYLTSVYGPKWGTEVTCKETFHPCLLLQDRKWDLTRMAVPCGPVSDPILLTTRIR